MIALHGDPAYIPHFEKLEAMLAEMDAREDAVARARRLVAQRQATA